MNYKSGNQQGGLFDYQERKELLRQQITPMDRLWLPWLKYGVEVIC